MKVKAKSDRVMGPEINMKKESFSIVEVYGSTQVKSLADENSQISIEELQHTINMQLK